MAGEGGPTLSIEIIINGVEAAKMQTKQLAEKGKSKWEELLGRAQALNRN